MNNESLNELIDELYKIEQQRISEIESNGILFTVADDNMVTVKGLPVSGENYFFQKTTPLKHGTVLQSQDKTFLVSKSEPLAGHNAVTLLPLTGTLFVCNEVTNTDPKTKKSRTKLRLSYEGIPYHADSNKQLRVFAPQCPPVGSILAIVGTYVEMTGVSVEGNVTTVTVKPYTPKQ